ncbi:hypothetical protein [Serratia aquatilis]|uniref:YD repeat-containing protein n=1 Tax=Serratia aquatilis TaxID=1737515 RepID=A0ABV6EHJ9_9GAMM
MLSRYVLPTPLRPLLRKTLPDGLVEQYDYDILGRLIAVNDGQTPLVWEYDIADRLVAEHQGWSTQRHAYHPQSGLLSASCWPPVTTHHTPCGSNTTVIRHRGNWPLSRAASRVSTTTIRWGNC